MVADRMAATSRWGEYSKKPGCDERWTRAHDRLARVVGAGSPLYAFLAMALAQAALAQELAPRAYWPTPVGTQVLVLGYQHSRGDIVVDPSLPVTGVDSSIDYAQVTYQRSYDWFGRSGTFQVSQAFADGITSGLVDGEPRTRRTVGALDTIARASINLRGAPAMDVEGMRALRASPRTIVGASLAVLAPTGQYDDDRIINLGTNRWTVRPGLGMIQPLGGSLLFEVEGSVSFFQDNAEFVGSTRSQDPVGNLQVHLVKRFRPGFWASLDANWYVGGRTRVDGERNRDLQRNSRVGTTLVYPFARGQALRFSASMGTVTETGGDFELFSLAWIKGF